MLVLVLAACLTVETFPDRYAESACAWEKRCVEFATASDEAGWTCSEDYMMYLLASTGHTVGTPCVTINDLNAVACIDNFADGDCDEEPMYDLNCVEWCDEYGVAPPS